MRAFFNGRTEKIRDKMRKLGLALGISIALSSGGAFAQDKEITLNQIMADPDWMGRRATNWYWGDSSSEVYFTQKREGSKLTDLYVQKVGGVDAEKVEIGNLHIKYDRGAVSNNAGTHEAYVFEGNVFLKELETGTVSQKTSGPAIESQVSFLLDGRVAYRSGAAFMAHDPLTGATSEIARLIMDDDPDEKEVGYLAREQRNLIGFIDQQISDREAAKENRQEIAVGSEFVAPLPYYFGKDNEIKEVRLSPAGDKLIVAIAKTIKKEDTDIMPNYVTEDGNIEPVQVRNRVTDQKPVNHTLFLVDLASGTKHELTYESLPDFEKDVLRAVREENHEMIDEEYESEESPRNIVLVGSEAIKWRDDGGDAAIMVEAFDNKGPLDRQR